MEHVDVVLSGHVLPGTDLVTAAAQLARVAGIDRETAQGLITSGRARVVKRGIGIAQGQRYVDTFAAMGIEAGLRPAVVAAPETAGDPVPERTSAQENDADSNAVPVTAAVETATGAAVPASAHAGENSREEEAKAFNPYTMPKADLQESRQGQGALWRDHAVKVPASHGWHWLRDAWRLFWGRPFFWACVCLVTMGCNWAATFFLPPVIGNIVGTVVSIVLNGGIVIMAHRQNNGESSGILDIFAGIRQAPLQLLFLAFLIMAYVGCLAGMAFLIIGWDVFTALASGTQAPELAQHIGRIFFTLFVAMVLTIPLILGSVFAPTLVAAAGRNALISLYRGGLGGMKNWSAFLVNGLVLLLFALFGGLAAGFFIGLLTSLFGESVTTLALIGGFGLLVLLPVFGIFSLMSYTASRDLFYEES